MIERGCGERRRSRMAILACVRKPGGHVVHRRSCGAIIVRVTRVAVNRCVCVTGSVALCALKFRVFAGQRESCRAVVKRRAAPVYRGVTLDTRMRKSARNVRGTCRAREIVAVAGITVRAKFCRGFLVTGGALDRSVGAGQGKSCRSVIKGGRAPSVDRVASLAVRRESARYVIRESHAHEIRFVAAVTISRKAREIRRPLLVADEAILDCVPSDEREDVVIEVCRAPADVYDVVALLASCREPRLNMVGLHSRVIVFSMAGNTRDVNRREIKPGVARVTACTIDILVGTDQREPGTLVHFVHVHD